MNDTLPKLLLAQAELRPDDVALREKEFGIWQSFTWSEYRDRVRDFAMGLVALGLKPGDKVAILGDNRPEWVIAELAAQSVGGVGMGVYQDCVAAEVQFLVDFCDAVFVVAEDQEQVDKIFEVRDELAAVRKVIYYDPRGLRNYDDDLLLPFEEVEALGAAYVAEHPDAFEAAVAATRPEDVAILATTSGTTGKPKAAMLSHRNLVVMAENIQSIDPASPSDEFLSLLPLPWIGEQMLSIAWALYVGFKVDFPEEPETVQENLREIGPQMLFSPPRIWENMVSEVQVKVEDASWLKRRVFDWAMGVGYRAADRRLAREPVPAGLALQNRLADLACFLWVKDKLGLRRLKHAYTGGAALGPDIFRFFHAMGVNLKQIYGQTEVSGISVVHRDGDIKFQTVGLPVPGTEIEVAENGEILTRSPAVFVGYYENREATAETLVDGWLHSGDAGYLDEDGHLIVIDRAKDVMTLGDGTRFSPQFIENKLKFSPYIKEAVVFGGDWPFVTAMVTIDYANAGKWAEKNQVPYTTFTDLAQKEGIYELVREHVVRMNEDLPEAARIRRFLLLHKELDADDAELTRTRKVRRRFVAERYEEIVGALYGDGDSVPVETEIAYQDGRTAITRTELRIETTGV
ncbi:MAG: long-chain fatty acid--CoA ligase [Thermoanaerobaculia bacterium]|nr:long-chain fatty acid--CoA ligase [Thermoanaerobaculia bacterium]